MNLSKRRRLLLRWSVWGALALIGLSAFWIMAKAPIDPAAPSADGRVAGLTDTLKRELAPEQVVFRFDSVAASAGIDFTHFPRTRASLLPEDMGSGLAWGDYDGDGDVDLYIVNFCGSILAPGIPDPACRSALYRNQGDGSFVDVSHQSGTAHSGFGLGAAWGDYDNDGDLDLYITQYGANLLYRNDGADRFSDVTAQAGVAGDEFSAGAAWADYDNDGDLDLYVSNYVQFSYRADDRPRATRQYGSEIPYTLNPSSYPPAANRLYRNEGDGRFTDIAAQAGVLNQDGRSLGAIWFDFDGDEFIDLYVANDVSANGVYRNRGDGGFEDIGASSLAADYRGAMGLAVTDYEHDGDMDLFVTHWIAQENAFFENMRNEGLRDESGRPRLFFMDTSENIGLGYVSLKTVGWATGFADFDNDGHGDLWVVNGSTMQNPQDNTRLQAQAMHVYRQQPGKGYYEVGARACAALNEPLVGRGGAQADYDADGKVDIAVAAHGGKTLLLRNLTSGDRHWLSLRLRQRGGNTRAIGARVKLMAGGKGQTAQIVGGGTYLSQNDTDLHFGLGDATRVEEINIHWPDGVVQRFQDLDVDRLHVYEHQANYGASQGK